MLIVTEHSIHTGGKVITDGSIPLMFRYSEDVFPAPYYWRIGNLKTSLVEIGIVSHANASLPIGAICKVTVVLASQNELRSQEIAEPTQRIKGIPVCNVSIWDERRFLDIVQPFYIVVNESAVWLLFEADPHTAKLYQNAGIDFGVDCEERLCAIAFRDVDAHAVLSLLS